jgi:3-oxoacyl-[acyl-carrier protein] reductase
MDETGLRGKVVLVTGAARGIGASIAKCFADHGCSVVIGDIDVAAAASLATAMGPSVSAALLDVCERDSVNEVVASIIRRHGRLDILVNNAGVLCVGSFDAVTEAEWTRLLGVNVTGVFRCIQAAVPAMKGIKNAAIVNIASISANKGGGVFGNVWYAATKAAVIAITKGLGRDLGPHGIRVNAISPGVVDTEMVHKFLTPEMREALLQRVPLGRFTTAEDIARAAAYLASDQSAGITGEVLTVDGGFVRT